MGRWSELPGGWDGVGRVVGGSGGVLRASLDRMLAPLAQQWSYHYNSHIFIFVIAFPVLLTLYIYIYLSHHIFFEEHLAVVSPGKSDVKTQEADIRINQVLVYERSDRII